MSRFFFAKKERRERDITRYTHSLTTPYERRKLRVTGMHYTAIRIKEVDMLSALPHHAMSSVIIRQNRTKYDAK